MTAGDSSQPVGLSRRAAAICVSRPRTGHYAEELMSMLTAQLDWSFMSTEALTVEHLERWVLSGAQWRVVDISSKRAVVDLCACTGELVERRQSDDPAVIGYLRAAHSDLDLN
jgi:hypothetical protein